MVRIVDIRAGLYLRAHNFTITQFKYRAFTCSSLSVDFPVRYIPRPASSPDSASPSAPKEMPDRHSFGTSVHCPLCSMRIDRSEPTPTTFFRVSVAECLEGAKFDPRKISAFVIFEIQNRNIRRTRGQSSLYITLNWQMEDIELQRARLFSSTCLNICIDSNPTSATPLACRYANLVSGTKFLHFLEGRIPLAVRALETDPRIEARKSPPSAPPNRLKPSRYRQDAAFTFWE